MNPPSLVPDPGNVRILTVRDQRDQRVMLDSDLAAIYGTTTAAFNQAVSCNLKRFPVDFSFTLPSEELGVLISQSVISKPSRGGRTKPPRVFTEHGARMAASILNSEQAVSMGVFIVRAFVQIREHILADTEVLKRLAEIDKTLLKHDHSLQVMWRELQPLLNSPPTPIKREMRFHTLPSEKTLTSRDNP
jgi:hypothetical protein